MDIKTFVNLDVLQQIQDEFADATGLAAIAVDTENNYITKGSNFTDFCMKMTRGNPEGLRRCEKCDNECTGTYFCHAGLMDFSTDIVVNGEKVGAIIGGQILPEEPDIEKFRQIAQELHIDEEQYIDALNRVPIRSEKTIRAGAKMLGNVINQLVNLEYYKKFNAKRINVFDSEIGKSLNYINQIQSMTTDLQQIAVMEKILALNASVEAAHAGTAGVGFSVVASEIENLSKRSSDVYQNIFDLITTIKGSINTMGHVQI